MNDSDLHHLAAAYALDALDAGERRRFEAHYPDCEVCSQDVVDFRESTVAMASAVEMPPPAELRDRVLGEIAVTRQLAPIVAPVAADNRRGRGLRTPQLLAVAAVILLVVGVIGISLSGNTGNDVDDLLAAPDAVVTDLSGSDGDVRLVWSPERDEVAVFPVDLPDPGDDRTYALWFLNDGDARPAALFRPDDDSARSVLDVDDLDPDGWGVTIEPAGGSDQPTGEILFTGTA